ncbi:c-type cytochrome [Leucothrix arctica]|uniref:Cytochrome c5 family protein n=1 Tax=Leucothrix arctica TaxID=1481894 RepID=A0A317CCR3_9GAMM|nr:c-type cytochrome [Leucothrix arctica]PWQ96336.1 cytochrome c5 family protein [Leucothrix arctica]
MEYNPQENKSLSLILFIAGAAVLAITVIALVTNLGSTISKNSVDGDAKAEYRQLAMNKILEPIGSVVSVDKSLAPVKRTGEQVYTAVCAACHSTGLLNSPMFGDKASWAPRAALGLQGLVASAIAGKGSMPARGGNPATTDEEIRDAILHMTKDTGLDLEKAGGESTEAAATATEEAPTETTVAEKVATEAAAPVVMVNNVKGIDVYAKNCFVCHDNGVLGSPKIAVKADWSARIAKGTDALHASAINGLASMPARGGNPSLEDDAIKAAVDYMVSTVK